MVVLLKKNADANQAEKLKAWLKSHGLDIHVSEGKHQTILGLVGDTSQVDIDLIRALDIVEDVKDTGAV